MFVLTAKINKRACIFGVIILAVIIALLVVLLGGHKTPDQEESMPTALHNVAAETNEERIAYLATYGWTVAEEPVETQEVKIPKEFNDTMAQYNALQIAQGFDLEKYAGKQAKRYVYEVTNYTDAEEPVYAALLVYKNKVIGGDLSSASQGGFMKTLEGG